MTKLLFTWMMLAAGVMLAQAQTFKFDFSSDAKSQDGFVRVSTETLFNDEQGFGYDLQPAWNG